METWKNIKNFEGLYQISDFGNVKSLKRKINLGTRVMNGCDIECFRIFPEKILKARINHRGYLTVGLWREQKCKRIPIHRLVAQAFIVNSSNKPEVNHKDGNKLNNFANSLEWNSRKENANHAKANKLMNGVKGENNHLSKLTTNDILDIRNLWQIRNSFKSQLTLTEIAKSYGVCFQNISLIINNKNWKHL